MEKSKTRKIIVHLEFDTSFEEAYQYLAQESPDFADKFKNDFLEQMEKITIHPLAYPVEALIPGQNGIYRYSVFKKSWKIIFKVTNTLLVFLKLFHVKQNPKQLKKIKKIN